MLVEQQELEGRFLFTTRAYNNLNASAIIDSQSSNLVQLVISKTSFFSFL